MEHEYPLNLNEINDLINLENLINKKIYKQTYFQSIVEKYKKLIEHFDNISDPMKIYFKEKLDDLTLDYAINFNKYCNKVKDNNSNLYDFKNRKVLRMKKFVFHMNTESCYTKSKLQDYNKIKKINIEKCKIISENLSSQMSNFQWRLKNRKQKYMAKSLKNISLPNISFNSSYNSKLSILDTDFEQERKLSIINEEKFLNKE